MKAFRLTQVGSSPTIDEIDAPEPGPGEVLVAVEACGLNFADLLIIEGTYQEKPDLPLTLGMEVAGTVLGCGPGVTAPARGSRVAIVSGRGGLAERGVFPAELCLPIPDTMSAVDAAAFQIAYGTSHVALDHRARLAPGERLLVLGAAGGVGLTAIEVGKLMGATVIACARGSEKLAVARTAGADHLIDTEDGDLTDRVRALGGADVVYDPVGGALFGQAFKASNPEARILLVGFASGTLPEIRPNHLLVKNISVLGHYWGGYLSFRPEIVTRSLGTLLGWYLEGHLKPHVSHILPLDRAAEGLDLIRRRASTGKVVVTP